ncbi:hypothetical protein RYX36_006390 [Vicia faba]
MILRLHKLLGNRWSLIAGRLPGRTANDVKNYWQTHLRKKMASNKEKDTEKILKESMKTHQVIKPQPRTFSSHSPRLNAIPALNNDGKVPIGNDDSKHMVPNYQNGGNCASSSQPSLGNASIPSAMWSDSLWNLEEQVGSDTVGSCSSLQEDFNFNMELPNADDSFWNLNICDFDILLDL